MDEAMLQVQQDPEQEITAGRNNESPYSDNIKERCSAQFMEMDDNTGLEEGETHRPVETTVNTGAEPRDKERVCEQGKHDSEGKGKDADTKLYKEAILDDVISQVLTEKDLEEERTIKEIIELSFGGAGQALEECKESGPSERQGVKGKGTINGHNEIDQTAAKSVEGKEGKIDDETTTESVDQLRVSGPSMALHNNKEGGVDYGNSAHNSQRTVEGSIAKDRVAAIAGLVDAEMQRGGEKGGESNAVEGKENSEVKQLQSIGQSVKPFVARRGPVFK
jgi:hypothetical protein